MAEVNRPVGTEDPEVEPTIEAEFDAEDLDSSDDSSAANAAYAPSVDDTGADIDGDSEGEAGAELTNPSGASPRAMAAAVRGLIAATALSLPRGSEASEIQDYVWMHKSTERYGLFMLQLCVAITAVLLTVLIWIIARQRRTLSLYEARFGRISDVHRSVQTEGAQPTLVEQRRAMATAAAASNPGRPASSSAATGGTASSSSAVPPPPRWIELAPQRIYTFPTGKVFHVSTACQGGGREYRRCAICCQDPPLPTPAPLPRPPVIIEGGSRFRSPSNTGSAWEG